MKAPQIAVGARRFENYRRRRECEAAKASILGFHTVSDRASQYALRALGNDWSRKLFDGNFYESHARTVGLPVLNLVFVQSRDGNTGAHDPSTLGGGDTDKHLIYEGLSRVAADGVLSGAGTARGNDTLFSVWHPELVSLRRTCGLPRHPAQILVTDRGDLPVDTGLMFQEPELRVFVIASPRAACVLEARLTSRPWVVLIDAGEPVSLTHALRELHNQGVKTISAIGGRRTATALLKENLVSDLYLTTSPLPGGEPHTPFYEGPSLTMTRVVEKAGRGAEQGVRFEHFLLT